MNQNVLPDIPDRPEPFPETLVALAGAATALVLKGDRAGASALYQGWIAKHDNHPALYAALFNYSTILTELGDYPKAAEVLEKSIALNGAFIPSQINLGRVCEYLQNPRRSMEFWSVVIDKLDQVSGDNIYHKTTALNQMGRVLKMAHQDNVVEMLLRRSLEIDRTQNEVIQHYLATRQRLCEWPLIEPWDRMPAESLVSGMSPLSLAVYADDPMLQLAVNVHYNKCDVGDPPAEALIPHAPAQCTPVEKLRIGYLSSDLREHAIGFLMAELFELHDPTKVEVFVYYCGIPRDDATKLRIKNAVPHWVSLGDLDNASAARRIADDGIHILVDVNGYTLDARTQILSFRPAPVIVNWLGFPGSMGSPYHHYIIADDWIIPRESEKYYSEKVLRLPCYQPNDRQRVVSPVPPTRAEAGLPENAIVYCCFNGTQKISNSTFDRWLTIMARVPNSVLWLLSGTERSHANLREYAEKKGIKPDRFIFADKKPNAEHLARYPLADLFLDTSPYGAHTTASDALWMGVPVVTLSGKAFASRVCASLVRAAGLLELACETPEAYIDRAVALGRDKEELRKVRDKLTATRDSCDLFNTRKLVRKLEDIYKEMWEEFTEGNLPVPDLSNLDVYLEVGAGLARDVFESPVDCEARWIENLKRRHAVRPIPADGRLWTKE